MQSWKKVWREGIIPQLSVDQLQVLKQALEVDDPNLLQGATTQPPPLQCVQDWPCEAACLLGYIGWKGGNLQTVGKVEEFFAKICFECDQLLGEPAACRYLLNYYDDTPRNTMIKEFLVELNLALENYVKQ